MSFAISRTGSEFLVNTSTSGDQSAPSMTVLSGGGFVTTWVDYGLSGDARIKAQIFNASGAKIGSEITVNTQNLNNQVEPCVTALDSGGFAVGWTDYSGTSSTTSTDIKAQIFDANGNRVGSELSVNTVVAGAQYQPSIVGLAGGNFAMSWVDASSGSTIADVKGQIFDPNGGKIGSEFLVNTYTTAAQYTPTMARLSNGGFAVAWYDYSKALGVATGPSIYAQMFDGSGTKSGSEFLVSWAVSAGNYAPQIATLAGGKIAAAWLGTDPVSGHSNIKVALISGTTSPVAANEIIIGDNASNFSYFTNPVRIAALPDGNFVISWTYQDISGDVNIKAQVMDPNGYRIGSEFIVNTQTLSGQFNSTLAAMSDGSFVIGWQDNSGTLGDNSGTSIKAQIFAPIPHPLELWGTAKNDIIDATSSPVTIYGFGGDDSIYGNAGSDHLYGGDGDDYIYGYAGDDFLDGGAGFDRTFYSGLRSDYTITRISPGTYQVADNRIGGVSEGVDHLVSVEGVGFANAYLQYLGLFTGGIQISGGSGNDIITPTSTSGGLAKSSIFDDVLWGYAGNDKLDGGQGADYMYGGTGNDSYVVDDPLDQVIENLNEGTDSVSASIRYILPDNVENLTLTGSANIDGTGNGLVNKLTGNASVNTLSAGAGNDTLDGGAGSDILIGGTGNDTYIVDNVSDQIVESVNEGTDTVKASVDYTLSANVEKLTLTGAANISGTGNALANTLTGNIGDNILSGGLGKDTLLGGAGNDTLIGGAGADRLTGGAGNDTFLFDVKETAANKDTIVDFTAGLDHIAISRSAFAAFAGDPAGAISSAEFAIGTAATTTAQHLIYNSSTGALYYDADGVGGAAQVQIAVLTGLPALTSADIILV